MPAGDGATVALDGFGAEQGFEALAEGARTGRRRRDPGPRLRPAREARPRRGRGSGGGADRGLDRQRGGPGPAVRARPEASVVRAARDVAEGGAEALVSHGSTGATMAAATFGLRRLKGVQRPALAVRLPVPGKPGPLPRRRRQRRRPRPAPGPVRLPRRRLQRGGARRRPAPGRAALGRRGGRQGPRGGRRRPRDAGRGARASSSPATSRGATCRPRRPTSSSPTASPATSR